MYGSEMWTLRKQDKHRPTASEMKFFRRTAGYTAMGHKRNEEITQNCTWYPFYKE
jgi:hypothetical protein